MSYDFLMFKVTEAVRAPEDLAEETTEIIGTGAEIQEELALLYPETVWTHDPRFRSIRGRLDGPDTWYEFCLDEAPEKCFSIRTSRRTGTRSLIPQICRALGLVAFDGQTCTLITG
jgi:hypothetical protein